MHKTSFLITLVVFTLVGALQVQAEDRPAIYPFDVKVGGQLAKVEGDPQTALVAKIADPVKADAKIEVVGEPAMVIINVFPANPDGTVEPAASGQAKVIMVQNGTETTLAETMDKSKLSPGVYLANVVYNQGTSRVLFTIE